MLLLPGVRQVRAGWRGGEGAWESSSDELLVRLQLGKQRHSHPEGFANNLGFSFLYIILGLSLWIPLPEPLFPFLEEDEGMDGIIPGQGVLGSCFGH